jgi:hypothetical protein
MSLADAQALMAEMDMGGDQKLQVGAQVVNDTYTTISKR